MSTTQEKIFYSVFFFQISPIKSQFVTAFTTHRTIKRMSSGVTFVFVPHPRLNFLLSKVQQQCHNCSISEEVNFVIWSNVFDSPLA